MGGCHANSDQYPMEWLDENDDYKLKSITYTKCRPLPASGKVTEVDPEWKKNSDSRRREKDMPLDPGRCKRRLLSRNYAKLNNHEQVK